VLLTNLPLVIRRQTLRDAIDDAGVRETTKAKLGLARTSTKMSDVPCMACKSAFAGLHQFSLGTVHAGSPTVKHVGRSGCQSTTTCLCVCVCVHVCVWVYTATTADAETFGSRTSCSCAHACTHQIAIESAPAQGRREGYAWYRIVQLEWQFAAGENFCTYVEIDQSRILRHFDRLTDR